MKILLLIFSLICSFHLLAKDPDYRQIDWQRFIPKNDKMPAFGAFKNDVATLNEKRTLVVLTENEKQILGYKANDLLLANFAGKDGKYYVIYIPGIEIDTKKSTAKPNAGLVIIKPTNNIIQKVDIIKEYWAKGIRPDTTSIEIHAMMKFTFAANSRPLLIANQKELEAGSFSKGKANISQDNAMISAEAVRANSQPNAGFFPYALGIDYAIAHLIYDYNYRVAATRAGGEGPEYEKLPLNFNESRSTNYPKTITTSPKMALFLEGIQRNLIKGRSETYNIFLNNCTNALFNIIDDVLKIKIDSYDPLKMSINNFIANDVPDLLVAVDKMQLDKQTVPGKLKEELRKRIGADGANFNIKSYLTNLSNTLGKRNLTPEEAKFLTGLPPFIDAQLMIRNNLLK